MLVLLCVIAAFGAAAALWPGADSAGNVVTTADLEAIEAPIPDEPIERSGPRSASAGPLDPFFPQGAPTSPDAAAAETVAMLAAAEEFWMTVGSGDVAAAIDLVDPASGQVAADYAGFVAALAPVFDTTRCERLASNAVGCSYKDSE
jgi:hypothetical protein